MKSMIETGAKALYEEGCRRAVAVGMLKAGGTVAWEDLAESSRRDYRTSFHAAFAAVRIPTDAMVEAGNVMVYADDMACGINALGTDGGDETSAECWRAMVDAALEETPNEK